MREIAEQRDKNCRNYPFDYSHQLNTVTSNNPIRHERAESTRTQRLSPSSDFLNVPLNKDVFKDHARFFSRNYRLAFNNQICVCKIPDAEKDFARKDCEFYRMVSKLWL